MELNDMKVISEINEKLLKDKLDEINSKLWIFNLSGDLNFREKRYNLKKDYKFFNDICLPYNMENLNNNIEQWLGDNSYNDFHDGERESYFKKILSNSWDLIINSSISLGNNHFAITINFPALYMKNENIRSYDNIDQIMYDTYIDEIFRIIVDNFKTLSYFLVVGERNKNGCLHFHCLVSIVNFIDYDYCIKNNLANLLKVWLGNTTVAKKDYDVKVQSLRKFKDIKNWAIYLYKDMYIWKFPAYLFSTKKYYEEVINKNFGDIIDWYLQLYFIFVNIEDKIPKNINLLDVSGVILRNNFLNQGILINLIQYYLVFKNLFIYNNNIYEKINDSLISYKLIGSVEEVLYNNFQENVIMFYTNNFKYYFEGFDFNYLMRNFFIKSKSIVSVIKDISTNKIVPDFCIMEFIDGLYFIKYDRFIPKNMLGTFENKSNLSTLKYYNKTYNWVRKNDPKNWIDGLLKSLNIKTSDYLDSVNIENLNMICLYLINIFHKNIFEKKITLLIHGESNTRKTTLIAQIISYFIGKENVGSIISSKNFKLQELSGKVIGILDEFKYNSSNSTDFLKLLGGEDLIVEKKYSKDHVSVNNIPIFIISNNPIKDDDSRINEALKSRIFSVEFFNPMTSIEISQSKSIHKLLKEEEPNIILYCNKIYFKKFKKIKKGNKFNNIKFIEHYCIK